MSRARPALRPVALVLAPVLALVVLTTAVAAGAVPRSPAATGQGAAPTMTSGVDYSAAGDGSLLLDVYEPADAEASHPAVVLVHGGGWTSGDRTQVGPDAAALAAQGFVAFSIEYDENGPSRWPDELDDVRRAVSWVRSNAATYRVDVTRIGMFGSSAGGNLAMLVGTLGLDDPAAPPIRAVVSWSGPTDLATLAPIGPDAGDLDGGPGTLAGTPVPSGCAADAVCLGVIDPQAIEAYLGCPITACPDTYTDASPASQVTSSTAPTLLVSAEVDLVPVEQAFEMTNALAGSGVASELLVVAGEGHAESYRATALDPSIAFFTRYLVDGDDPRTATTTPPSTVAGSQPLPALEDGWRLPAASPPSRLEIAYGQAVADGVPVVAIAVALALAVVLSSAAVLAVRSRRRRGV